MLPVVFAAAAVDSRENSLVRMCQSFRPRLHQQIALCFKEAAFKQMTTYRRKLTSWIGTAYYVDILL